MKTFTPQLNHLRRLTLVVSLATASLMAVAMAADKGSQTLMKLAERGVRTTGTPLQTAGSLSHVHEGDSVVTACPDCENVMVTRVTKLKGHIPQTKTVSVHRCPGCSTRIEITGQGKAAERKVTHTCPKCGSGKAFCAVLKAASTGTPAHAKPDAQAAPAQEGHDHAEHQH